jgi:uncharacterized protein
MNDQDYPAELPKHRTTGTQAGMSRRKFLAGACVAAAALDGLTQVGASGGAALDRGIEPPHPLIDTNVSLSHWPLRRLPLDEPSALEEKLRRHGVTQAWAGSFEAILHRDIAGVNARLAETCHSQGKGFWFPLGTINPTLAGWRDDLRRCHEEHRMQGVRIFPNYHDYTLAHPAFAEFLDALQERDMILQLAATIEDARVQHSRLQAAPVDLKPLPGLLASRPRLKLVLLNWNRALNASVVPALSSSGRVYVDIATLEGVGGLSNLLKQVSPDAVVFGSHAPFYYFESALLKLKESELEPGILQAIRGGNAARLRL